MIGATLKKLRGIYGYSAAQMAELLDISRSYLSEIETGKKQPSLPLHEKYAGIFNIRTSSLLRFSEEYGAADEAGFGQDMITRLMSKVIDMFAVEE